MNSRKQSQAVFLKTGRKAEVQDSHHPLEHRPDLFNRYKRNYQDLYMNSQDLERTDFTSRVRQAPLDFSSTANSFNSKFFSPQKKPFQEKKPFSPTRNEREQTHGSSFAIRTFSPPGRSNYGGYQEQSKSKARLHQQPRLLKQLNIPRQPADLSQSSLRRNNKSFIESYPQTKFRDESIHFGQSKLIKQNRGNYDRTADIVRLHHDSRPPTQHREDSYVDQAYRTNPPRDSYQHQSRFSHQPYYPPPEPHYQPYRQPRLQGSQQFQRRQAPVYERPQKYGLRQNSGYQVQENGCRQQRVMQQQFQPAHQKRFEPRQQYQQYHPPYDHRFQQPFDCRQKADQHDRRFNSSYHQHSQPRHSSREQRYQGPYQPQPQYQPYAERPDSHPSRYQQYQHSRNQSYQPQYRQPYHQSYDPNQSMHRQERVSYDQSYQQNSFQQPHYAHWPPVNWLPQKEMKQGMNMMFAMGMPMMMPMMGMEKQECHSNQQNYR